MMELREAIKATLPDQHGMFHAALVKAEAEESCDKADQIFGQACEKADGLFDGIDDKYPDNQWSAIEIIDQLVEWITESPSR